MLREMPNKLRWGVLSSSKFFLTKVLPAMQQSGEMELVAIASRDAAKSAALAAQYGIPHSFGSYEELLADPSIDVVYNPLPNHLHVPWSIAAAKAGKHVLCEKPLALTETELDQLLAVRAETSVKVGEAFMVATHPQWLRARQIVQQGLLGELRAVQGFFSYHNVDPANIRNNASVGGGAIWDIGCYPTFTTRFVTGQEPLRVLGLLRRDPNFATDRISWATMDFADFTLQFTVSTQCVPYQKMHFFGTKARLEIEIPFNAPPDRPCRLLLDTGKDLFGGGLSVEEMPVVDQYTVEVDAFTRAVRDGGPEPVTLENARGNLRALRAIFASAETGAWVTL